VPLAPKRRSGRPFSCGRLPVITGSSGRERIYDGYPDVALEMISSRTFDGGIQLLEYLPTILSGPPRTNTDTA
jgi:hypothetical protein